MGWVIRYRENQSYPISGAVIETFNILYENEILELLKAPDRTVHAFLFAPVYMLACTIHRQ